MNKLRDTVLWLPFIILLIACNNLKKITSNNNQTQLTGNPVIVPQKTLKKQEYQPSATRTNDIIHTKLDVKFDYKKQHLYGKAIITAKPYFYPTSTLLLDAREMEIKEVALVNTQTSEQTPLKYKYANDILQIELDRIYKNNERYTVYIQYVSKPNELKQPGGSDAITDDKGLYFIDPLAEDAEKPTQIWTQGETQSSSVWFPTIDKPNERMTQEVCMTVEKKYITLSNGELAFSIENADSTRTDCWKMSQAHAPYLVMMAVGEFAVIQDTWREKQVDYYVEKEYAPYAKAIFGNTPQMLEFYSTRLGVDYPWNKYAQIVVRDYVSGAMENTTATIFGEFIQRNKRELLDKNYEQVIAHELFHQWFGDLVTCESWSNIPLNESFATYGEYLWNEHKYGRAVADYYSEYSRNGYFAEAQNKQLPLIRYYYNNRDEMFDAHSYNKGGQILHMLRKYVGDDAFFASLKKYLQDNKYSAVEIHNLRLAFEQVTGEDLNWFFNQWFLSSGHPDLRIANAYDAATGKLKLNIRQAQDTTTTPVFKIPLVVDVYTEKEKVSHKIVVTQTNQSFEFNTGSKPLLVNVDAEKMLLCEKEEQKTVSEWVYQYNHAPLYLDKKEALSNLLNQLQDTTVAPVIIKALGDKRWSLRLYAISELKKVAKGNEQKIKNNLVTMAVEDSVAQVREAALRYLAQNYTDKDLYDVYKYALNDSSYAVLGTAIIAIAKADTLQGVALAKKYENENNKDVLIAIAEVYARYGTINNHPYFLSMVNKFKSYSKARFINTYGTFLKKVDDTTELNKAVEILKKIQDDKSNKWAANSAKKVVEEIEARPLLKQQK